MIAANQTNETRDRSIPQTTAMLLRHGLGDRKVQAVLALAAVGAGLAFNWSWLVAAGIAPILVALAPCAVMCALGVCMNKVKGACSDGKGDGSARAQAGGNAEKSAT